MSRSIVFGILVLLLGATFLFSRQVHVESISETAKVSNHYVSTYENVTKHEGDLVINGTHTFVIENCTYIQRGDIIVSDFAKMKIYNSIFRMEQDYWHQFDFSVESQARLEIANLSVDASKGFGLSCEGYSNININHSSLNGMGIWTGSKTTVIIDNCTCSNSLVLYPDSKVVLSNSSFDQIRLGDVRGVIRGLQPGYIDYFRISRNQTGVNVGYDLTLENTSVKNWIVDVNYGMDVLLSDSTIGTVWIWYGQTVVKFNGLHPGYFEDFHMHNLTLRNTGISNIVIAMSDSVSAQLLDTKVELQLFGHSNFISLLDSEVAFLARFSSATLSLDRSRLIGGGIADSQIYICGNVTQIEWHADWFSSNVTRNYAVAVRDIANDSLESVELTMFDSNNSSVWNGTTDSLGQASFNITFSDGNYTGWSQLKVHKEAFYNTTMNINLLSSTPITINMTQKPIGDINEDRTVNIVDVTLVARSFSCIPTDEGWNELCDLNKDDMINIVDITLVAKDYGKTV